MKRRRLEEVCDRCRRIKARCVPVGDRELCYRCMNIGETKCTFDRATLGHSKRPKPTPLDSDPPPENTANHMSPNDRRSRASSSDGSLGPPTHLAFTSQYSTQRSSGTGSRTTTPDSGAFPFNSYAGYSEWSSDLPGAHPSPPASVANDDACSSGGQEDTHFFNPVMLSSSDAPHRLISRPSSPILRPTAELIPPPVRRFVCPIPNCDRKFFRKTSLTMHSRTHNVSRSGVISGENSTGSTSMNSNSLGALCAESDMDQNVEAALTQDENDRDNQPTTSAKTPLIMDEVSVKHPSRPANDSYSLKPFTSPRMGISSLDDNFAVFDSALRSPLEWLRANQSYLLTNLETFSHLVDWGQSCCMQFINKQASIYHRFLIYTMAHITQCAQESGQRLLDSLKSALMLWTTWDHVTILLNHQRISRYLWTCIRICKTMSVHECDKGDKLRNLLALDIAGICAQVALTLEGQNTYQLLFSRRGDEAQVLLNLLQSFLDIPHLAPHLKGSFIRALFRLSRKSCRYPDCLVLRGVEGLGKDAVAGGRFAEVFKAEIHNEAIAVKVVRMYLQSDILELAKHFSQEAVTWSQLSHPNILPFYGIYHLNDDRSRLCFVSPWMDNGTIVSFLKNNPQADRRSLYLDVALGLEYLHTMSPHLIHGDLKGVNILMTPSHRACLADFGLVTASDSRLLLWSTSTGRSGGTVRWQAPELLSPGDNGDGRNTLATDIYALACVGYEIFTDLVPFHEVAIEGRIVLDVTRGKRPTRPSSEIGANRGLNDALWSLIDNCWTMEPEARPTATNVVNYLRSHATKASYELNLPQSDWDPSFVGRLRSNLEEHPFFPPPVPNIGWDGARDPTVSMTAMLMDQLESFTWTNTAGVDDRD